MGYAPVLALEKLFAQTGLKPSDIGTAEVNEAFASQAIASSVTVAWIRRRPTRTAERSPSDTRSAPPEPS